MIDAFGLCAKYAIGVGAASASDLLDRSLAGPATLWQLPARKAAVAPA
ncbi:hypothetical protein [Bosea vestrisii]|uniref:Uncharacterized protein n=1 Tax=Bosea vestrisii TaxID=151416 RepID=A0ABW0H7S9_9HYPH